jgi:hypothetical protein
MIPALDVEASEVPAPRRRLRASTPVIQPGPQPWQDARGSCFHYIKLKISSGLHFMLQWVPALQMLPVWSEPAGLSHPHQHALPPRFNHFHPTTQVLFYRDNSWGFLKCISGPSCPPPSRRWKAGSIGCWRPALRARPAHSQDSEGKPIADPSAAS